MMVSGKINLSEVSVKILWSIKVTTSSSPLIDEAETHSGLVKSSYKVSSSEVKFKHFQTKSRC